MRTFNNDEWRTSIIAAIPRDIDSTRNSITPSSSLPNKSGDGDKVADLNELQVADSNSLYNNIAVTASQMTDEEGLTVDTSNITAVIV